MQTRCSANCTGLSQIVARSVPAEPEQSRSGLAGTAAAAAPAAAAMADPAAAGGPPREEDDDALAGGEAEDALALAEPAPDMSKHKSGIIPILQCVAAALQGGPRATH